MISKGFEACEGKQKKCMNRLMTEIGDKRQIFDEGEQKVKMLTNFTLNLKKIAFKTIYQAQDKFKMI